MYNFSWVYNVKVEYINVDSIFSFLLFLSSLEENKNDGEIDDLLAYLQQQLTVEHSSQKICQPEVETSQVHISGNISKFLSDTWCTFFFFCTCRWLWYWYSCCWLILKLFFLYFSGVCGHSIATRGADVHLSLGGELGFGYAGVRTAFPRLQGFLHLCKVRWRPILFAVLTWTRSELNPLSPWFFFAIKVAVCLSSVGGH